MPLGSYVDLRGTLKFLDQNLEVRGAYSYGVSFGRTIDSKKSLTEVDVTL